jgi:hypothetical protein
MSPTLSAAWLWAHNGVEAAAAMTKATAIAKICVGNLQMKGFMARLLVGISYIFSNARSAFFASWESLRTGFTIDQWLAISGDAIIMQYNASVLVSTNRDFSYWQHNACKLCCFYAFDAPLAR